MTLQHPGITTHCPHGHELTEENTYVHPRVKSRSCRECMRSHRRKNKSGGFSAARVPYDRSLDLDDLPGLVLQLMQRLAK